MNEVESWMTIKSTPREIEILLYITYIVYFLNECSSWNSHQNEQCVNECDASAHRVVSSTF